MRGQTADMPVEVTWCWDRIYEAGPGVKIKKANCAWGAADWIRAPSSNWVFRFGCI